MMGAMSTQLSLLDLISDQVGPAAGGDPRVAAARESLAQASLRRRQAEPAQRWVAVHLDAGTCELGRRRVAKAREVIAAARIRAEEVARNEADARQRAALSGVISLNNPANVADALQVPLRRPRRARPAA
ncbi:MAG TPA: hypothetical protein DEG13_08820 [Candidatus Microthrix parvicella]|jgi:hypothetical protein|uniref:Uncharacterized protein n=2 Tax=Microthrixaceae TaxID=1798913 RepID=R4Z4R2_9ACTN|nr:hypothetical protein BN381_80215 [Candidatus Microthrix parvicella RN1]HBX09867.1 hypothetical protein [Candidatus Microthrix parvicella]